MPLYEYYCRPCSVTFEMLRPMSDSSKLAICPSGHRGATRSVSLVARPPRGESGFDFEGESRDGGGGCGGCGPGGCSCGH